MHPFIDIIWVCLYIFLYFIEQYMYLLFHQQVVNPTESFFYSSMISTNEEGSTSYENVLYSGPCDGVDDEGRWKQQK